MSKDKRFQWYDSAWLRAYADVRDLLREQDTDALDRFTEVMSIFRTDPSFQVKHIPEVFPSATMEEIRKVLKSLTPRELEIHEAQNFGRWVVHDHPYLTQLQAEVCDMVSRWAGEEVEPCYNFLSMYTQLGRCPVHMDTPQAKYTLDICVDQSEPWDIHFSQVVPWPEDGVPGMDWSERVRSDPALEFSSFALQPGEAILFSGSSQWHFRDPIPNGGSRSFCDLVFFHYLPKGTAELVEPANWPEILGIPELAELPSVAHLIERKGRLTSGTSV